MQEACKYALPGEDCHDRTGATISIMPLQEASPLSRQSSTYVKRLQKHTSRDCKKKQVYLAGAEAM